MKRFTMAVALVATLALAGKAVAVDVEFISGSEWDLGDWSTDGGATTGLAFDFFGRDNGWYANGGSVPVDAVAVIGEGDDVLFDGGVLGDFRWRNREQANGGGVRIEGGGKLEIRSSVAEDGEWAQFDAEHFTVTGEGSELNRTLMAPALNGGAFTFGSWRTYHGMQTTITVDDGGKMTGEGQLWFGAYGDSDEISVTMNIGDGEVSWSGGLANGISLDDTAGEEPDFALIYNIDERPAEEGGTGLTQENDYSINFTEIGGKLSVGENGIRVQKETEVDVWESTLTSYEDLWDMGILQADGGNNGSFSDIFTVTGNVGDAVYSVERTGDPTGGSIADLNLDGFVDGLDLGILLGEWDPPVAAAMGITGGGAVPEPTSAVLLVSACCLLGLRRKA